MALIFVRRQSASANRAAPGITASGTATIARPQSRVLSDGSVIELRDGTELKVDYSGPLRRVFLQRGEAHFQVAKNKARPFVVVAAGVEARALGTAFSVQLHSGSVEVLVSEGRVSVEEHATKTADAAAAPLAVLEAGHRALVPANDSEAKPAGAPAIAVERVTRGEIAARLAWRVPRLELSRTPLTEVVALMNQNTSRWRRARLVIGDDSLRDMKLSGFLRADNVDGLVELLAANFGIVAEQHGDTEIVLRRPVAQ